MASPLACETTLRLYLPCRFRGNLAPFWHRLASDLERTGRKFTQFTRPLCNSPHFLVSSLCSLSLSARMPSVGQFNQLKPGSESLIFSSALPCTLTGVCSLLGKVLFSMRRRIKANFGVQFSIPFDHSASPIGKPISGLEQRAFIISSEAATKSRKLCT